jgi:hypothetical protein
VGARSPRPPDGGPPPLSAFTPAERRIVARCRTPRAVQRWLNRLPYNTEPPPGRATLRSFRGVVRHGTAHCLEAALAAAVVLEQHGYPPLVLSFESIDQLDHVIFVYRRRGRWGAVARSRDPGLHGRKPVFRTARDLALSYVDPYVDATGRITGYAVVDLRVLGRYDWRLSERNVWKVERLLLAWPHRPIRTSDRRIERLRRRYLAFVSRYPGRKPLDYRGRETWTELPAEFTRAPDRRRRHARTDGVRAARRTERPGSARAGSTRGRSPHRSAGSGRGHSTPARRRRPKAAKARRARARARRRSAFSRDRSRAAA